jgi:hypothetical protein
VMPTATEKNPARSTTPRPDAVSTCMTFLGTESALSSRGEHRR